METARLVDLVNNRVQEFLNDRASILVSITPELMPLAEFSRDFLSAGKRFRAQFCYWGWRSVFGPGAGGDPSESADLRTIITAAASLELFHAAALVHDDVIDSSDTRRGAPSAHRRFEELHRSGGWSQDAAGFGRSAAILLGDLLLGWSDELLDSSLAELSGRDAASAARSEFNRMRTEVTAGQYLDVAEENAWNTRDEDDALPSAKRVILYKSAKYSVEAPLAIGAVLAGATPGQLDALRGFGIPLGVAFQLRDDLLGVFGDASVTGKPSGDDLREGKRTVLIALARQRLQVTPRRIVDELLGDPDLDDAQIRMLQRTLRESGVVDTVESMIAANVRQAHSALDEATLSTDAVDTLRTLADRVTSRSA